MQQKNFYLGVLSELLGRMLAFRVLVDSETFDPVISQSHFDDCD